ncbi:MAG: hypothetical protein MCM46_01465 [Candidatus Manganitrophus sp. SB1]|nr:hypothetical protein [Candidatus Manganitrophus morganii]
MKKLFFLVLLFGFPLMATLIEAGDISIKIIVHPSNPVATLKKTQISNYFLKKTSSWETGRKVLPVDQSESSPARIRFTEEIHGKEVHSVISYWQKQIFSGRDVPPVEKNSDREVITFVRENPDAIGYVSEGTALDGVKVVRVLE